MIDGKIGGDMALSSYRFGTHTGVFPNTLLGRDASHGGVTWTTKYNDAGNGVMQTYDDGIIPDGVFAAGTTVTLANGAKQDVSGLTFQDALNKGYVEPSHASAYYYRYGSSSTGVADYWIFKSSWISLKQVTLSYVLPSSLSSKIKAKGITVSLIGRDLCYLYNSLPFNFNPASYNSTSNAAVGESGFMPMVRSIGGSIILSF